VVAFLGSKVPFQGALTVTQSLHNRVALRGLHGGVAPADADGGIGVEYHHGTSRPSSCTEWEWAIPGSWGQWNFVESSRRCALRRAVPAAPTRSTDGSAPSYERTPNQCRRGPWGGILTERFRAAPAAPARSGNARRAFNTVFRSRVSTCWVWGRGRPLLCDAAVPAARARRARS
jgi:hypothetical protein